MMATYTHTPVMLERSIELLGPALAKPGSLLVDATVGLGGHAEAFLRAFPALSLLGIDRDPAALALSAERLAPFGDRVRLRQARFDEVGTLLDEEFPGRAPQAFLFDLGVSSLHLDDATRGFSYRQDADLDMRMNPDDDLSASDIVNDWTVPELADIFRTYGDEPLAGRYARAIVEARPIRTTGELVSVIDRATPAGAPKRGHRAKRVFQALRIAVNAELEAFRRALPEALDRLAEGGRIVILSYHSGEDRIAKHLIHARTVSTTPVGLPVIAKDDQPEFRWVVRGPEYASDSEVAENSRSQSVRLRAAEKRG